ncbi:MAG TPA: plastocyanin/azurin family copper-binding protein [Ktedonobacteraceae bacterium]|nr:plastocyanin/azurin family copper-binding protein [Ktedonobacteraceae bacterium]
MQNKPVKLLMMIVTIVALMSIFFAACSRTESSANAGGTPTAPAQSGGTGGAGATTPTPTATSQAGNTGGSASGGTEVHMGDANFVKNTVTISKGGSLLLIDDSSVPHIIQNGSWNSSNVAQPAKEAGAPTVQVQFQGNDRHSVGPFTTAGTYHLYCTIHQGMNLTVTVQ